MSLKLGDMAMAKRTYEQVLLSSELPRSVRDAAQQALDVFKKVDEAERACRERRADVDYSV